MLFRLSRLIREGSRNPAIVRVTLLNQGVDAYKHEQYGDSITVERRIAKSGTAGYRLLAHDGKTVRARRVPPVLFCLPLTCLTRRCCALRWCRRRSASSSGC